ncbi:TRAP transporter small permease [Halomonas sp. GD1P12]|uniref:TRAP transporter small permease n=1 Tax=Halomonas sp. GD1P12 TaxID=2982691 RepID=UPI0021E44FC6|nr:TRAP transporter small permease [Halomonas sp. GD1P12]UYG00305.1 TRAP transporter small permease [Halomonas sp. GD1P12]
MIRLNSPAYRELIMPPLMQWAERLLQCVRLLISACVIVLFAYMVIAILTLVAGRYIFDFSIAGAAESATFAQIWVIFLAAGLAMRERLHIGVDILYEALPDILKRVTALLILVLGSWFLWLAILGSQRLLQIGQMQTSSALGIPMWIPYLSLPVGLGYFFLEFLIAYLKKIFFKTPIDNAGKDKKGATS